MDRRSDASNTVDRRLNRVEQIVERGQLRAIAPTEVKRLLTLVSITRHRAFWNQPVARVGELISQFSILTKATNCEIRDSQQYNFTETYQLYLFIVELKKCIIRR
ncbi:hypothetical protein E5S67_02451 [Microcoleus sp. IPMA8]|uniref:Uncharacterized protein n=1 Tax=Microcoleus asticus IPMA8 TaxID=2563858 RepID=A0ABX2CYL2_9CYAN|nr:hypothetical protein [Microcoleus asticus IPMA8]